MPPLVSPRSYLQQEQRFGARRIYGLTSKVAGRQRRLKKEIIVTVRVEARHAGQMASLDGMSTFQNGSLRDSMRASNLKDYWLLSRKMSGHRQINKLKVST